MAKQERCSNCDVPRNVRRECARAKVVVRQREKDALEWVPLFDLDAPVSQNLRAAQHRLDLLCREATP